MSEINPNSTSKALFKNTGIIAIGQAGTKIINFFLLPVYTAILSTEEYGLFDLLTTYATIITVVIGLQISQAAFRFLITCRNDRDKTKRVISSIIFSTIFMMIFYIVVFIVVSPAISISFKWYLLFNVLVSLYLQTTSCIARGLGNNSIYALGNFISVAVSLILNIIVVVVFRLGIDAMLLSYIIGPSIGGTFLFFKMKLWKFIDFQKVEIKEIKLIIKYAFPLVPNELSWSVIHGSDRVIISSFLGVAANGIIAVASKFSAIYTTIFSVFNASWTEQVILHYKDNGGAKYINDMFNKVISLFACIALAIIACMPFVFDFMVDEDFKKAYELIPFYMIAVFFNAVIGMISAIYLVENETRQVAISTIISALINIIVNLVLVEVIGCYAAPISSICGYAFISFWRLYDVNKRHCEIHIPLKKIMTLILGLIIVIATYYMDSLILSMLALGYVIILFCFFNKQILINCFKFVIKRI